MNNPFHSWLIRQRRYCEHQGCLMKLEPATKVVNRNGKDYVYCDWHSKGQIQQGLNRRYEAQQRSI